MEKFDTIDQNFHVDTKIEKDDIKFYSPLQPPFSIHGVFYEGDRYRRLPEQVARETSPGVLGLHAHTAGGRVRFRTNSHYIAIHAVLDHIPKMPHFAITGVAGFDIYEEIDGKAHYLSTFMPPFHVVDTFENVVNLPGEGERDYLIHFPLYSEVKALYIGLEDRAVVSSPAPYPYQKPVVYYGSSITQGGCASRPGNAYENIISRRLGCEHLNLGFSGNAKGEERMAQYIAGLDMSIFVLDYDFNAPTPEHLEQTHERFFTIVRKAHPNMPIILLSRPQRKLDEVWTRRRRIIEQTYQNALRKGDKNVYFIPGEELMKWAEDEGTVDTVHPTDYGFFSMAKVVGDLLLTLLPTTK